MLHLPRKRNGKSRLRKILKEFIKNGLIFLSEYESFKPQLCKSLGTI